MIIVFFVVFALLAVSILSTVIIRVEDAILPTIAGIVIALMCVVLACVIVVIGPGQDCSDPEPEPDAAIESAISEELAQQSIQEQRYASPASFWPVEV